MQPRRRDEPRAAGVLRIPWRVTGGFRQPGAGRHPEPAAAADVLRRAGTGEPEILGHGVVADLGATASEDLTEALVKAGVPVRQIVVEKPDLEEMFVGLTGEGFDVDE